MRKKILSIALILCMLLAVMSVVPIAAATTNTTATTTSAKDITLGYAALHNADTENAKWDYVYFGTYNGNPIKWRVLSTEGSSTTTGTGTVDTATYKTADGAAYTGNAMFMLWENTWFGGALADGVMFGTNNKYQGSELQKTMKKIFSSGSEELKYVLKTTKTDSSETISYISPADNVQSSLTWAESNLSDDTIFALSAREVEQYLGSGDKYANRINGDADWWWLRSPLSNNYDLAGIVVSVGGVGFGDVRGYIKVRPAMNLNSSKILFTSAAEGGKSSDIAVGIFKNKNYTDITGNDGYKLTLLDESRSGFSAYLKSVSGNTATVSYSGAKTGENEYISVIIKNGTDVKYYGRVAAVNSTYGEIEFILPGDYDTEKGDVLCVFNEQYNGDKNTDYASDVVVLPDYRWYLDENTVKSEFTIYTASQLLGFANLVNGIKSPIDDSTGKTDFEGKTVKLGADIDLSCIENWTPIGNTTSPMGDIDSPFSGTFDGQGHKILGLTVNSSAENVGFFGYCDNAKIRNLAVYGNITCTSMSDKSTVGGIAGYLFGEISNCSNFANVSGSANYAGGIAGAAYKGINNCYNQGNITSSKDKASVGGIAGMICPNSNLTVSSCYSVGKITATRTDANVGAIIGHAEVYFHNITINKVYYNNKLNEDGIGNIESNSGKVNGEAEGKSTNEFVIGEVAWLLQNAADDGDGQVWGQMLDKDSYPVFANENGSNTVYKVTFKSGEIEKVKYVNNGGTVSSANPSKDGHTFDGWYTAATGGTKFELTTAITSDITLYARFTPNTYTVSYNAGENCTGTVAAGTKTYGVDFTLSSDTFKRTGYTQTGWATTDGGEEVYDLGGSYTKNEAITLYPVWEIKSYIITVYLMDGEEYEIYIYEYGDKVTEPTLTRDGYEFDGWDKTFPTTMPDMDGMTITAKWKDITAPTGEIKVGDSSWSKLSDDIDFDIFFKNAQSVKITATDNDGEDVKIEYLISDRALTTDELLKATFIEYSGEINIKSNGKYIIYAKLTDKSGNAAHISSGGIVIDNVAPVISGIIDGETYCDGLTATVTDANIDTVTVNGRQVTVNADGKFALLPADGNQRIIATDKAGNITSVSVIINNSHTGGTATCKDKARCEVCGEEYGEVDGGNHVGDTEIRNAKDATCTDDGYTGDTYCKSCEKAIDTGKVIEKAGHIDSDSDHKCDACGAVVSECSDGDNDHKCDICGKVISSHTGGAADCTHKAICGICGEEYGDINADNHTTLSHFGANEATTEADGNMEYWRCDDCGKCFSDEDGKDEIELADTVIAKIEDTKTGGGNAILIASASVVGVGALAGAGVYIIKKKHFIK